MFNFQHIVQKKFVAIAALLLSMFLSGCNGEAGDCANLSAFIKGDCGTKESYVLGGILTYEFNTTEDTSFSGSITLPLVADAPEVSYSLITEPTLGLLTAFDKITGLFTYAPFENTWGTDTFYFQVVSGQGNLESFPVTAMITVSAENDIPVAFSDFVTTPEETAVVIDVLANDIDVDFDQLMVIDVTGAVGGAVTINVDGTVSYIPSLDFVGVSSFQYTITDGFEGNPNTEVVETATVIVINTNDTPITRFTMPARVTDEDAIFVTEFEPAFDDVDLIYGDMLTYTVSTSPGPLTWVSINQFTGRTTGVPENFDAEATYTIIATAWDLASASVTNYFTLFVDNVNDIPRTVSPISDITQAEDSFYYLAATAHFTDIDFTHGDSLTYYVTSNPHASWLGITVATGEVTGIPRNADAETTYAVTIIATDRDNTSVSNSYSIFVSNVNDAPVSLNPVTNNTQLEDVLYMFTVTHTAATPIFFDDDIIYGDHLTYFAFSGGGALPAWMAIDQASGQVTMQPGNGDAEQNYSILLGAVDLAQGLITTHTYNLFISNVNDSPEIVPPGFFDQVTNQGQNFSYQAATSVTDVDWIHGDTVTYYATLVNGSALPSWLSVSEQSGEVSGTPANTDVGEPFRTYQIRLYGRDVDGLSAVDDFDIQTNNINDAPYVVTPVAPKTATEDIPFTYTVASHFSDPDFDMAFETAVTFTARLVTGAALPAWITCGMPDGICAGTPTNWDSNVTLDVQITAWDTGTIIIGPQMSVVTNFTLTVLNVNDAPSVTSPPLDQMTDEDLGYIYDWASAVTDIDFENGTAESVTYYAFLSTGAAIPAWLSIDQNTGTVAGVPPNAAAEQTYAIELFVKDDDSPALAASDTYNLYVRDINDPPQITALGVKSTDEDQLFYFNASSHVTDVDFLNPFAEVLTYDLFVTSAVAAPWLSITAATGELSGTPPNAAAAQTYAVVVTVTDRRGWAVTDTLSLFVQNINDAPMFSVVSNKMATQDTLFLFNSSVHVADIDFNNPATEVLTYYATFSTGWALPAWIAVTSATGELTAIAPNAAAEQTYAIQITVADLAGAVTGRTFDLYVQDVNDTPVFQPLLANDQATEEQLYYLNASTQVTDADFLNPFAEVHNYTYFITNTAAQSWLFITGSTGEITGVAPNSAAAANYAVVVTVVDRRGWAVTDVYDLTVNNVNDAPVFTTPLAAEGVLEDTLIQLNAAASVADDDFNNPAPETLNYYGRLATNSGALPYWIAVTQASGLITAVPPNAAAQQVYAISVTVQDLAGATTESIFNLTVTNVNDAPVFITSVNGQQTALEDQPYFFNVATMSNDIDIMFGDSISFEVSITNGAQQSWLYVTQASGGITAVPPNAAAEQTYAVLVTVTDLAGATVTDVYNLYIQNVNDGPQLISVIVTPIAVEDTMFFYDVTGHFYDRDVTFGDFVTFSAELATGVVLPGWLAVTANSGEFSGIPLNADVQVTHTIVVTAYDRSAATITGQFDLTVSNVNDAPTVVGLGIPDHSHGDGTAYTYNAAPLFTDIDIPYGDSLTYFAYVTSYNGPLTGVSIVAGTGVFTGTPTEAVAEVTYPMVVMAIDAAGAAVTDVYDLYITNVNQPPVVMIANKTFIEDQPHTVTVASEVTEPDSIFGDSVTAYFAEISGGDPLPAWLSFSLQGTFTGMPGNSDVDVHDIQITAWDENAAAGIGYFQLTVSNVNDAPIFNDHVLGITKNTTLLAQLSVTDIDNVPADWTFTKGTHYPTVGSLGLTASTGQLVYTPPNDFLGTVTFIATVDDGGTPALQVTATVFIEVLPNVRYVKKGGIGGGTSWSDAMGTIQAAVDALAGVTDAAVWIAEGTYKAVDTDPLVNMEDGVYVYGGFDATEVTLWQRGEVDPSQTVLSGNLMAYHVVSGANSYLEGVQLFEGNASGLDDEGLGAGLFVDNASLTVSNVEIVSNTGQSAGGLYVDLSATVYLTDVVLYDNSAIKGGGGVIDGELIVEESRIIENMATNFGGGLYIGTGSVQLTNSLVADNDVNLHGAGLYNEAGTLLLASVSVDDNDSLFNGAGIYNEATMVVVNTSFVRNNAQYGAGGAIWSSAANVEVTQTTFAANDATRATGGAVWSSASFSITNSVFFANDAGTYNDVTGTTVVDESCSDDLLSSWGTGNVQVPLTPLHVLVADSGEPFLLQWTNCLNNADDSAADAAYSALGTDTNWLTTDLNGAVTEMASVADAGRHYDPRDTWIIGFGLTTTKVSWSINQNAEDQACTIATSDDSFSHTITSYPSGSSAHTIAADVVVTLSCDSATSYDRVLTDNVPALDTACVAVTATGLMDGSSWGNATSVVQDAVDMVRNGSGDGEVWISFGDYIADTDNAAVFFTDGGDDIDVYGGMSALEREESGWRTALPGLTILNGDRTGDGFSADDSYHAVDIQATVGLYGLTVTGGNASGAGLDGDGGGVFVNTAAANGTLNNVVVAGNQEFTAGGQGGGGVLTVSATLTIRDSVIRNNVAPLSFDGIAANSSTLNIENSLIADNDGQGISQSGGNTNIDNVSIVNNSGHGVVNSSGTINVRNSSLENNLNGVNTLFATINVDNCAFFGNNGVDASGIGVSLSNSCGETVFAGMTVMGSDPFIKPMSGELFLNQTTSCVDLGNNAIADTVYGANEWLNLSTDIGGILETGNADAGVHYDPSDVVIRNFAAATTGAWWDTNYGDNCYLTVHNSGTQWKVYNGNLPDGGQAATFTSGDVAEMSCIGISYVKTATFVVP